MKRKYILWSVLVATFITAIEGTVVAPASPAIIKDLGDVSLLSWIYTSYFLASAVFTPIFGKFIDLFGRKRIFMIGITVFTLGSLLCAFAGSMGTLITFRLIQGIGAGALVPVLFTIIGDIYEIQERGKVQGMISSVWGITALIGPLVGGYLVDFWSWRGIFAFNIPFAIVSMWMLHHFYHEQRSERTTQRIDYLGSGIFMVGMTSFLLSLSFEWWWLLGVSLIILALFIWVESRIPDPILPVGLLKIRDIFVVNVANMFRSAILIGLTTYFPLWAQGVRGASATLSGLLLMPMNVGWITASVFSAGIMLRIGQRTTAIIFGTILLIGSIGMVLIPDQVAWGWLIPVVICFGLGFGAVSLVFMLISQSVPYEVRGSATSLNSLSQNVGTVIGVAVLAVILNMGIGQGLEALKAEDSAIAADVTVADINALFGAVQQEGGVSDIATSASISMELMERLDVVLANSIDYVFVAIMIFAACNVLLVTLLRSRKQEGERLEVR
jgi:MFS family permease